MLRTAVGQVVLPVANEDVQTCEGVRPYLTEAAEVVAPYVVEEAMADSRIAVETGLRYGTDLIAAIFETAEERNVECIAFVPRPEGWLIALFSGDPGWNPSTGRNTRSSSSSGRWNRKPRSEASGASEQREPKTETDMRDGHG